MILHGVWLTEDENILNEKLFLWAEQIKPELHTSRRNTKIHPYALSSDELLKSLKVAGNSYRQILYLPSYTSSPIHSSLTNIDKEHNLKVKLPLGVEQ